MQNSTRTKQRIDNRCCRHVHTWCTDSRAVGRKAIVADADALLAVRFDASHLGGALHIGARVYYHRGRRGVSWLSWWNPRCWWKAPISHALVVLAFLIAAAIKIADAIVPAEGRLRRLGNTCASLAPLVEPTVVVTHALWPRSRLGNALAALASLVVPAVVVA